jgi:hypothetical protein
MSGEDAKTVERKPRRSSAVDAGDPEAIFFELQLGGEAAALSCVGGSPTLM